MHDEYRQKREEKLARRRARDMQNKNRVRPHAVAIAATQYRSTGLLYTLEHLVEHVILRRALGAGLLQYGAIRHSHRPAATALVARQVPAPALHVRGMHLRGAGHVRGRRSVAAEASMRLSASGVSWRRATRACALRCAYAGLRHRNAIMATAEQASPAPHTRA